VDEYLSIASISNIETGANHVSKTKVDHYCRKLKIDPAKVAEEIAILSKNNRRISLESS
jgi:hypothetical protein